MPIASGVNRDDRLLPFFLLQSLFHEVEVRSKLNQCINVCLVYLIECFGELIGRYVRYLNRTGTLQAYKIFDLNPMSVKNWLICLFAIGMYGDIRMIVLASNFFKASATANEPPVTGNLLFALTSPSLTRGVVAVPYN